MEQGGGGSGDGGRRKVGGMYLEKGGGRRAGGGGGRWERARWWRRGREWSGRGERMGMVVEQHRQPVSPVSCKSAV